MFCCTVADDMIYGSHVLATCWVDDDIELLNTHRDHQNHSASPLLLDNCASLRKWQVTGSLRWANPEEPRQARLHNSICSKVLSILRTPSSILTNISYLGVQVIDRLLLESQSNPISISCFQQGFNTKSITSPWNCQELCWPLKVWTDSSTPTRRLQIPLNPKQRPLVPPNW